MFVLQISVISFLLTGFSIILIGLLKRFGLERKLVLPLLIPLLVFSFGFSLRLTGKQGLVNLGFFLTDFSTFFVSVLFTTFLFLGQLKYWKK